MSWEGYKTRRWRKLRERVLRRDGYLCQEAARYGKKKLANTVHHVWPAEDYPEYAWQSWNLISLSQGAHDAMHDRYTRALTAAGKRWQRKISPPSFALEIFFSVDGRCGGLSDGEENDGGGK